jgi:hypothetical protein
MKNSSAIESMVREGTEADRVERTKQSVDAQLLLSGKELEELVKNSEREQRAEISERAAMWARIKLRERKSIDSGHRIEQMNFALLEISEQEKATPDNRDRIDFSWDSRGNFTENYPLFSAVSKISWKYE